jgi:(p)ppGpp synthase/HD superfamily hydrolase
MTPQLEWTRLAPATRYAFEIHAKPTCKETSSASIARLMTVSALVLEHTGDEELAVAAILREAIRLCGPEEETIIAERFGPRVVRIVHTCADIDALPDPARQDCENYLLHLEDSDPDVLIVLCAEKLQLARTILSDLDTENRSVFNRLRPNLIYTLGHY